MSDKKIDLSAFIPEGWEGKLPPCMIQVDPEGNMSHDGAPMIHQGIIELIHESVHLEDGHYIVRLGEQACELEVADTFYVVSRIDVDGENIGLTLNDGSSEELDLASLYIGGNDVMYCTVKNGGFPARFARKAYYQMTEMVQEAGEGFDLVLGGKRVPLAVKG
jgi:uncharacterized protein